MHVVGEIVIQKFGGAALASLDAMKLPARIVASTVEAGRVPCVVVSAMGPTTDELLELAGQIGGELSKRELDALLACGENMSAALFALCLRQLGLQAVSLSGAQAGIATSADHGGAAVTTVRAERVTAMLRERRVPVVAGFQGLAPNGDTTTLGRGGSDLTAVVLGAAVGARVVELFKDVSGIYDRDPNEGTGAILQDRLDYDALLAIIRGGGHAVLQNQAVEYAKNHRVVLRVVPFAEPTPTAGTLVKNPTMMPPASSRRAPSTSSLAAVRPSTAGFQAVRAPSTSSFAAVRVDPKPKGGTAVFEAIESNVRGYCRSFPTVFAKAKGALQWDEAGKRYIDFFSGAGALNYGHNNDAIKQKLLDYIAADGVSHALDMYTQAKREFLETFRDVILAPRGLDYKVQFCGPTGANSVEAALKLARLATKRTNIVSFTGGWHGMTTAALSICGNKEHREAAGAPLPYATVLPFADGPYKMSDSLGYITSLFEDPNSGFDLPAAIILETLQSEGGIYDAPPQWLRAIRALCDRYGVLMIADDIQVGCGRTGSFFSFERAGIIPDLVTLSKSIGGYGQPMALLLMRPDLDVWKPGQHTGTFRGNQLAFIAAAAALENWKDPAFGAGILLRGELVESCLRERIVPLAEGIEIRGRGMMWGLDLTKAGGPDIAKDIATRCFKNGLIIERCGRDDTVLKVMAPLNIEKAHLVEGLEILTKAARDVYADRTARATVA